MGGRSIERRPMEKPRRRWKDAILSKAIDLLQIWKQEVAARNREGCTKKIG
jgi:hypothetical protein